jgi:hypothetical protein
MNCWNFSFWTCKRVTGDSCMSIILLILEQFLVWCHLTCESTEKFILHLSIINGGPSHVYKQNIHDLETIMQRMWFVALTEVCEIWDMVSCAFVDRYKYLEGSSCSCLESKWQPNTESARSTGKITPHACKIQSIQLGMVLFVHIFNVYIAR